MNSRFALDKPNAKLMGVCAGLARATGTDPLVVRLAAVALGLITGPALLLLYTITAWVAPEQS